MQHIVIGAFNTYAAADQAVQELKKAGFPLASVTENKASVSASSTTTSGSDDGVLAHVSNFFGNLFGDEEHHAAPYAEAVRRGGAVVKLEVQTEDEAERARDALEEAGAVDINEEGDKWRADGWTGGQAPVAATRPASTSATGADGVIPVIKEELEVGKRTVETGGVRVFARTVSTPVNESVQLRTEHAEIHRRPVNRAASAADLNALQDRTIEVRETAERAVVSKTARVVEEVSVGKTVENRTENISDSVRHTEVDVERLPAAGSDYDRSDKGYRADFATRYGSTGANFDDYAPAYQYGHGLRSNAAYSGRPWTDVESDARRGWESIHPNSAWEKVKGAVNHAWESVTK